MDEAPTVAAPAPSEPDYPRHWEADVVSAHRTPDLMFEYAETAQGRGPPETRPPRGQGHRGGAASANALPAASM